MVSINTYLQLLIYAVYGSVSEAFLCWLYNVIAINVVFKCLPLNPVSCMGGNAVIATDDLLNYGEKTTLMLSIVAMVRKMKL